LEGGVIIQEVATLRERGPSLMRLAIWMRQASAVQQSPDWINHVLVPFWML
jgi:hypothetical protein